MMGAWRVAAAGAVALRCLPLTHPRLRDRRLRGLWQRLQRPAVLLGIAGVHWRDCPAAPLARPPALLALRLPCSIRTAAASQASSYFCLWRALPTAAGGAARAWKSAAVQA